jgi:hypothetical protein
VTLDGLEGNGRLQTTFKSPIFAKVTLVLIDGKAIIGKSC